MLAVELLLLILLLLLRVEALLLLILLNLSLSLSGRVPASVGCLKRDGELLVKLLKVLGQLHPCRRSCIDQSKVTEGQRSIPAKKGKDVIARSTDAARGS